MLTLLELQSHFGDNPLKFRVLCPQIGTAVLKGLSSTFSPLFVPTRNSDPGSHIRTGSRFFSALPKFGLEREKLTNAKIYLAAFLNLLPPVTIAAAVGWNKRVGFVTIHYTSTYHPGRKYKDHLYVNAKTNRSLHLRPQ